MLYFDVAISLNIEAQFFPSLSVRCFYVLWKKKMHIRQKQLNNTTSWNQQEMNWKWTFANLHFVWITLIKISLFWMDIKKTIWFFFFFWGKVKLIWELRHTLFINLRLRQILNVATSALFYKTLRSAADKFTHSVVCGNTYATRNLPYTALLHYWSSKDSFLKINSSI